MNIKLKLKYGLFFKSELFWDKLFWNKELGYSDEMSIEKAEWYCK